MLGSCDMCYSCFGTHSQKYTTRTLKVSLSQSLFVCVRTCSTFIQVHHIFNVQWCLTNSSFLLLLIGQHHQIFHLNRSPFDATKMVVVVAAAVLAAAVLAAAVLAAAAAAFVEKMETRTSLKTG